MDFSDMKISEIEVQDHLEHHGILGQRWGVRRYQNADGTLTDLGKKRYGKELRKKVNAKDRNMYKEAHVVGLSAAIKANNRNATEAREKVANDPKYVKALHDYMNARDDLMKLADDLQNKYKNSGTNEISEKDQKKMQTAERRIMNCQTAEGEAWLDAVKRHEPEILSAKLADIGEPDTPAGRELIKGIYENKRKNSPNTYDWIYD